MINLISEIVLACIFFWKWWEDIKFKNSVIKFQATTLRIQEKQIQLNDMFLKELEK